MAESNHGIISVGITQSGEDFIRASVSRPSGQAFVNELEIFSAITHDRPDYLETVLSKEVDAGNFPFYFNTVIDRTENWTPLHMAAFNNSVRCAELLIKNFKSDVTVTDRKGKTPLHWAIERNADEVVYLMMVRYKQSDSYLSEEEKKSAEGMNKAYEIEHPETRRPKMHQLVSIVIPKIKNLWIYIADALEYKASTIRDIEEKGKGNAELCCKDLLRRWLGTDEKDQKTWLTFLDAIKKVDAIPPDVTGDIIEEVKKLK